MSRSEILQEIFTKPSPTTFYPTLNEDTVIEVSDELPVVAFGCVMPQLPQTHFRLPRSGVNNMHKELSHRERAVPRVTALHVPPTDRVSRSQAKKDVAHEET
eukprot:Colp12_sorted_trinity150504_noHs@29837